MSLEIRRLIREMSVANPLWGAPRIHGEFLNLGIEVGQTSVAKYMARRRGPPSQDDDGKTFIRELRTWSTAPVLVLSAREQETEKVDALDAGADDYLVKPFGVPELLARVSAQLRRASIVSPVGAASSIIRFGQVSADVATHEVTRAGEQVRLTER